MTLFIACLVIYGLDLSPWLYAVALAVWLARTYLKTIYFNDMVTGRIWKNWRPPS